MDIAQLQALKKSSASSLAKITAAVDTQKKDKTNQKDERFWQLEGDAAGNGSAIIRFLPARDDDELPWVKIYSHGFKGPSGKWYIENSLTTINKADPVVEANTVLWESGIEKNKAIARERKRKLAHYSNILVISDPKHPENEGKVFVFKYGKKIFDKINDKLHPAFEDEDQVNVFDPWSGANFRLRMRRVDGYANFDKSEFDSQKPITDDDEEMLRILNGRHRLGEFLESKNFKSYEELKAKFERIISDGGAAGSASDSFLDDEEVQQPKKPERSVEPKQPAKQVRMQKEDEDDEDLSFFKNLVED